jgi:hypothetical protein
LQVLRGHKPLSALDEFQGKRVGGHELMADFDQLSLHARAGALTQLDSLYVSSVASA